MDCVPLGWLASYDRSPLSPLFPTTTMKHVILPLLLLSFAPACQSIYPGPIDAEHRKGLFSQVTALAGTWERTDPQGAKSTAKFEVTSAGSVVREVMFPGTEHEMSNMYSLDGNDLVMTHYCAGGNQPSMRAKGMSGNSLPFQFESVRDLTQPDQTFMGEMTLIFNADGSVQQRWKGLKAGQADPEHEMVFDLKRQ